MKQIMSILMLSVLILAMIAIPCNAKQDGISMQKKEVLEVLKKFQAGYTARDVSKVDAYVNDLFDSEDILVIGTSAYKPIAFEWCEDLKTVKAVVENDWKNWGILKTEWEESRIRIDGNTAWIAMWGTSTSIVEKRKKYDRAIKRIADTIELNKNDKGEEVSRDILFWSLSTPRNSCLNMKRVAKTIFIRFVYLLYL